MATSDAPRSTTRWDPDVYAWLVAKARSSGVGVGTVNQAIVRAEMLREEAAEVDGAIEAVSTLVKGGGGARAGVFREEPVHVMSEEVLRSVASLPAGTVPRGAASSPSGAAPASRPGVRLDVVVARQLTPGAGQIPPVALASARRLIGEGGVAVSGRGSEELAPDLLVGPGEVVLL